MRDRPSLLRSVTPKVKTACGNMYVTVTFLDGEPLEIFSLVGKTGGCAYAQCAAIGGLINALLIECFPDTEKAMGLIEKQLSGISCFAQGGDALSCPEGFVKALKAALKDWSYREIE